MNKVKIGLTAFLILIQGGVLGVMEANAGNPITLNIDQSILDSMSEDRREIVRAIKAAFDKRQIESLPDYQAVLPSSEVTKYDGQIIRFNELFQPPSVGDEPQSLSFDEEKNRLHLSDDQLETFRKQAIIKVASKRFPGKYHVWKINTILQKGSDEITLTFKKGIADSLSHVVIGMPENLWDKDSQRWNVRKGAKNVLHGLRGIASSLIGLIEKRPEYTAGQILDLIESRKKEYVVANLKKRTSDPQSADYFDGRLFNEELSDETKKKVAVQIHQIERDHAAYWEKQEILLRKQLLKESRVAFPEMTNGQRQVLLEKEIDRRQFEALNQRLRENEELNALAPGYGALFSNQRVAARVTREIEDEIEKEVAEKAKEIREELIQRHSYLSKLSDWLEPRVEKKKQEYYREIRWARLARIPERLKELGLVQEANIASEVLEFQQYEEAPLKESLSKKEVVANSYQFKSRIWNSKNWKKREIIDFQGNPTGRFEPVKYETSEVTTNYPLWRWHIIGERSWSFFKGGLYHTMVTNLWNGPLGLRAMNPVDESFCMAKTMDEDGNIVDDPNAQCSTYRGNLKGIKKDFHAAVEAFESAPENGLLGKGFSRPFFYGYQWLKRGLSTVVVGVGQPVMTVCNALLSCTAAVTSPVWAPVSSLFVYGISSTIYDVDYPGSSKDLGHSSYAGFPLFQYALGDIGVAGVGQGAWGVGRSALVETPAFVVKGLYSFVRAGARKAWDGVVRGIIKKRMYVPGVNSVWATRISGPDMANQYLYQVSPEVAILALQAVLEGQELSLFVSKDQAMINAPLKQYYEFFSSIAQPIGSISVDNDQALQLAKERDLNTKALETAAWERRRKLTDASVIPGGINRSRIRLSQENLRKTLEISEKIVASFYAEHLLPRMNQKLVDSFWQDKVLEEGDFYGLTLHYLANAFDNDFLIPWERENEKDDLFVIEVKHDQLKDIFAHFPI